MSQELINFIKRKRESLQLMIKNREKINLELKDKNRGRDLMLHYFDGQMDCMTDIIEYAEYEHARQNLVNDAARAEEVFTTCELEGARP